MAKKRVLVVDDNTTARMGARALLDATSAFACVAVAASGYEALDLVATVRPDLVLMDVHMDGMRGAEATRKLRHTAPSIPIVAWTSSTDSDDLVEMMHAGCVGYTLKDLGPSELEKALTLALKGETPVPRQVVTNVLRKMRPPQPTRTDIHLTARERQILRLMSEGMLTKEIAHICGLSTKAVEAHSTTLYVKLEAKNRSQAVAHAIEWGVLGSETDNSS